MKHSLYRGDCMEIMAEMTAGSVQLIMTSPQYNIGWDYGENGDGDRLPIDGYIEQLMMFVSEAERLLDPEGGVLVLNLPSTIREKNGARAVPISSIIEGVMYLSHVEKRSELMLREPVYWIKSATNVPAYSSSTAIGAFSNPFLRPCCEKLIIASRGTYRIHGRPGKWPKSGSEFGPYLEVCKDVWHLPPGRAKQGKPLAFPDELVRRCLRLYANPGDAVLDPYAGTGTVARIADELGMHAHLIESNPDYWGPLEILLDDLAGEQ